MKVDNGISILGYTRRFQIGEKKYAFDRIYTYKKANNVQVKVNGLVVDIQRK